MKKLFPFLIGAVILLLLGLVIFSGNTGLLRKMDERITLKQSDKIPYGTHVAKTLLPSVFPVASVAYDIKAPGDWDNIDVTESAQAIILIADYMDVDGDELKALGGFVAKGNYVFIITRNASDALANYFHFSFPSLGSQMLNNTKEDSLRLHLLPPGFPQNSVFTYPGKSYDNNFTQVDTSNTLILGKNENGLPNFIRMDKGKGSFFIHAAPLAFSNYFILHKKNIGYYENALSAIPKQVRTVVWNEYYLLKLQDQNKDEPNWLGALFGVPAFKWGLIVSLCTLAIFILLSMRRKQQAIPLHQKPVNDSLDFVKTLGRLYYDKSDHKNLATKMAAYFLEHVRSVYKLPTHTLDEDFVTALHHKSGYPIADIEKLVAAINHLQNLPALTESQLAGFYKKLELFYQNT